MAAPAIVALCHIPGRHSSIALTSRRRSGTQSARIPLDSPSPRSGSFRAVYHATRSIVLRERQVDVQPLRNRRQFLPVLTLGFTGLSDVNVAGSFEEEGPRGMLERFL